MPFYLLRLSYLAIISIPAREATKCKDARTLGEPEGCRVSALQQMKNLFYCPISTRGVVYAWEISTYQHTWAQSAGSQPVSLIIS